MIRHAFLELRTAIASDFNDNGKMKLNAIYFEQNADGSIQNKIRYLNNETDKTNFKMLFDNKQIFVFVNPDEVINIDETTILEWNEL
jgi:hypothetical protein